MSSARPNQTYTMKYHCFDCINFAYKHAIKIQRKPIIWDESIIDKDIRQPECLPYVIQVWKNEAALYTLLDLGYPNIVSIKDYFNIGGKYSPKDFAFPDDSNILGYEVIWYTSESDNAYDVSSIKEFMLETKDF